MVEPLEDSRSELTFVTEMISASLGTLLSAVAGSKKDRQGRPPADEAVSGQIDLDEVEIQKGTLQVAKGLAFLHQQAKMVHLNLSPDAILINAKVSCQTSLLEWLLTQGRLETVRSESDHAHDEARRNTDEVRISGIRCPLAASSAMEAGLSW